VLAAFTVGDLEKVTVTCQLLTDSPKSFGRMSEWELYPTVPRHRAVISRRGEIDHHQQMVSPRTVINYPRWLASSHEFGRRIHSPRSRTSAV
jgi:hypothetical protein